MLFNLAGKSYFKTFIGRNETIIMYSEQYSISYFRLRLIILAICLIFIVNVCYVKLPPMDTDLSINLK